MGQDECLKVLKKNGKWMTVKEVSKILDAPFSSVGACLRNLWNGGDVKRKTFFSKKIGFKYKIKVSK